MRFHKSLTLLRYADFPLLNDGVPMALDGSFDVLDALLETRQLQAVFQPVFDIKAPDLLGYEALIRCPSVEAFSNPLELFRTAAYCNRLLELEALCLDLCCEAFVSQSLRGKLFLNISSYSLQACRDGDRELLSARHGLAPTQIVIELSERYPLDDYRLMREATHFFRSQGFEIAIDDLGAGYSGLRSWAELQPDYVKIDRHFIDGIHASSVKWEFVRSIVEIAKSVGSKVIAEGVEQQSELLAVANIGIRHAQGFFLGKPQLQAVQQLPECLRKAPFVDTCRSVQPRQSLRELVQPCVTVATDTLLTAAADIFREQPLLSSLPVLHQQKPVGIVGRHQLLELMSQRFAHELYRRALVGDHMQRDFLKLDATTSLADASRYITDRPERDLNLDLVATDDEGYLGVVRTRVLLQRITELQLRAARYANPLTLLPGNVPLYEHIDQLLENKIPFRIAYCDLNHFKPYNDHYGYDKGDTVIRRLAECIRQVAGNEADFAGHVGGDDFIVVLTRPNWLQSCQQIMQSFDVSRERFYDAALLEAGGHWGTDRAGNRIYHPLVSLAIGVVWPDLERCMSHHDVATLAVQAKQEAKKHAGSYLFVSRRRGP